MGTTPETVEDLIAQLSLDPDPEREAIASELGVLIQFLYTRLSNFLAGTLLVHEVLQSIYGEDALKIWTPPSPSGTVSPDRDGHAANHAEPGTMRLEATLSIEASSGDDDEEATHSIILLVSLPPTYPSSSPPQLQLLSRYIGPYGVDAPLFGMVLRTFISRGAVEWTPGGVCVFDGLEWVKERCIEWLGERMSEKRAGELLRDDERGKADELQEEGKPSARAGREPPAIPAEMPAGITLVEAEPIVDRKSVFIGRACRIADPSQVPPILEHLLSDRRIARAAHPIINAWRCRVGATLHQDNDDDGETPAGGRLAHLLQILEVDNVLIVVTRYFGGIHLGPDRFKHINQAARNALELGGFLDTPDEGNLGRKHGKGRAHAKR